MWQFDVQVLPDPDKRGSFVARAEGHGWGASGRGSSVHVAACRAVDAIVRKVRREKKAQQSPKP